MLLVTNVNKALDILLAQLMETYDRAIGKTIYYQPPLLMNVRGEGNAGMADGEMAL